MNLYDKIEWVRCAIQGELGGSLHGDELDQALVFAEEIKQYIEKMIEPSNMFFELDVKEE